MSSNWVLINYVITVGCFGCSFKSFSKRTIGTLWGFSMVGICFRSIAWCFISKSMNVQVLEFFFDCFEIGLHTESFCSSVQSQQRTCKILKWGWWIFLIIFIYLLHVIRYAFRILRILKYRWSSKGQFFAKLFPSVHFIQNFVMIHPREQLNLRGIILSIGCHLLWTNQLTWPSEAYITDRIILFILCNIFKRTYWFKLFKLTLYGGHIFNIILEFTQCMETHSSWLSGNFIKYKTTYGSLLSYWE